MRDFLARVSELLAAGLTKATTKSRVALDTVRLRRQLRTLAKEKKQALAQLGVQVYPAVCQRGQAEQEEVSAAVARLQERDRAIATLQQEIRRLAALEAATPLPQQSRRLPPAPAVPRYPEGRRYANIVRPMSRSSWPEPRRSSGPEGRPPRRQAARCAVRGMGRGLPRPGPGFVATAGPRSPGRPQRAGRSQGGDPARG
jgi:hypothetical protein